jgi:hypothetical protein
LRKKKQKTEIAVIPPQSPSTPLTPAPTGLNAISQMVESFVRPFMSAALATDRNPEQLTKEQHQTVTDFMEALEPEIDAKAKDMLTFEIRDRLIRRGDFEIIERNLRLGRKPQLKRKTGCLFIQFGTGEANDPIEEFMVATS